MTVLIVDDDPIFGRSMLRMLRKQWARTARTLGEGLAAAGDWQPSILMLDVQFRDDHRTGIDMIGEFKVQSPRSQIIIVTGRFDDIDQKRALDAGAIAYADKADAELLRDLVEAAHALVLTVFVSSSRLH